MPTWTLEELDILNGEDVDASREQGSQHDERRRSSPIGRRMVVKGVLASAAALGWMSLRWTMPSALAETGPNGLQGWDRNDCLDAYPGGYSQQPTTDGSNWPAACFGSTMIGPAWCTSSSNGWSKNGQYAVFNGWDRYTPATTACGPSGNGKNAWRWTVSGQKYRCSDGNYTYNRTGTTHGPYFYQCQSKV